MAAALVAWMASAPAAGAEAPAVPRALRRLAVQHNGRLKPFESFARETLRQVTGDARWRREDPAATVLSLLAAPEPWQATPMIAVPFRPLRELLGMPAQATHISHSDLVGSRKLMRMLPAIVEKQRRGDKLSMLEHETLDAFGRFVAFSNLVDQRLALVPPPPGSLEREWRALEDAGYPEDQLLSLRMAWAALLAAWRQGRPEAVASAADTLASALQAASPGAYPPAWRLDLEVFYNRAQPFHLARWLYLAAALVLAASMGRRRSWRLAGLWACRMAFAIHAGGIALRVVLGSRPPVSNFFETMLWLPFVGVLLALVFERVYQPARRSPRPPHFALAASLLAALTLFLADVVPLDSSITPVVAVLRSNLWLTVHVLTIVASYGAIALAAMLAHLYGALYLRRARKPPALRSLDLYLYRTLQVGVVLLAGGIMLGAVWANASWGRYWGWDPKETWALITLLWYLAILHGRFAGWLQGIGVALSTIGGFFLLLMTYYGVSFYLVGLHSYAGGHAKPLPPLLVGYLVAEAAFLVVVGAAALRRSPPVARG
jgi:cytochrome c-type biogenesis protein CcsB